MSWLLGILFLLMFMAAQGAAVFGTAWLMLRLLKTSNWIAKLFAMAICYVAWCAFTITGYALLGGEGGLMDGFGMILGLCILALISSFVFLVAWTVTPKSRPVSS